MRDDNRHRVIVTTANGAWSRLSTSCCIRSTRKPQGGTPTTPPKATPPRRPMIGRVAPRQPQTNRKTMRRNESATNLPPSFSGSRPQNKMEETDAETMEKSSEFLTFTCYTHLLLQSYSFISTSSRATVLAYKSVTLTNC